MIYRKLSSSGDYLFGNANEFLSGVEAVAQAIITRIKLLQEEWWEDLSEGTPLWQNILGQPANVERVDDIIKERISGTQGVSNIESYESSFNSNTREYSFYAVVNTIYGTTTINEVL